MKPVKVAICDDDAREREIFYNMCRSAKQQEGIAIQARQYESGDAMLFHFEDSRVLHAVDIVLLDIHMPGQTGMEVAAKLREYGFQGAIIFVTRSKELEHLRAAFDMRAFNYITKDDDMKRRFHKIFMAAAEEARRRRGKTLIFSSVTETRQIDIESISYFEVKDHVLTVHYNEHDSFSFISTLIKVENLVYGEDFIRVHRSFLVAVLQISSLNSGKNSLELMNGAVVPVGRKYKAMLQETMKIRQQGGK